MSIYICVCIMHHYLLIYIIYQTHQTPSCRHISLAILVALHCLKSQTVSVVCAPLPLLHTFAFRVQLLPLPGPLPPQAAQMRSSGRYGAVTNVSLRSVAPYKQPHNDHVWSGAAASTSSTMKLTSLARGSTISSALRCSSDRRYSGSDIRRE